MAGKGDLKGNDSLVKKKKKPGTRLALGDSGLRRALGETGNELASETRR
jgi:hypothetical protein